MKLSEAIRLGSQQYPKAENMFFYWGHHFNPNNPQCIVASCCAMGAAIAALDPDLCHVKAINLHQSYSSYLFIDLLGMDEIPEIQHPITNRFESLSDVISTLNDSYGWTREHIADWLEQKGY